MLATVGGLQFCQTKESACFLELKAPIRVQISRGCDDTAKGNHPGIAMRRFLWELRLAVSGEQYRKTTWIGEF
jgi:hypothetical protein